MKKYISKFHYLTQDLLEGFSPMQQVQMACENGAKWIQYRVMPRPEQQWIDEANEASMICDDWGTTLILNDRPDLAVYCPEVQGVHIGRNDMHPQAARELLGPDKVIGASALSIEDVKFYTEHQVDYISIGPYNYTETKKISIDPRGASGIRSFINEIHDEIPGFDIPLIVAGGIQPVDIEPVFQLGIYGVAVSSAINRSEDPGQAFRSFYKAIY